MTDQQHAQNFTFLAGKTIASVRYMTEQECKDAVAFFKSPIGAKFIDVQPVVFGNISDVMEPWRRHLAQRIFEMARDEMKKKGHSL